MHVLVTGSNGFIGQNLIVHLNELETYNVLTFSRENSIDELKELISQADAIIHLAGENRPADVSTFNIVNTELTQLLCDEVRSSGRLIPILFASSIQADFDNPYGRSKLAAEIIFEKLVIETGNPVFIYRLPGVFGKWCRPNKHSVVATFCNNIANGLPIQINEPSKELTLVYIDDVVTEFINAINPQLENHTTLAVSPEYKISVGELALQINNFRNCRKSLVSEQVGNGLIRLLYSAYTSYLPPDQFSYSVPVYSDHRGLFVEMLKTKDSGQFSFFTAHPGVTRGGHYHHSKTEKFMVIRGTARFGFRHVVNNESHEIVTNGNESIVVDTVPGWTHDITNIGDDDLIVMLWSNEIFNRDNPDTIVSEV
jgi:UDP-2-acetamido-2,6-beta-L-arabino-hexul-4-ose reductase